MKHLFTLLAIFMFATSIQAQVTVGTRVFGSFRDFDKGEYDVIKAKTTVFVVDDLDISEFEDMIKDVWTYNDYIVVDRKDYDEDSYKTEKYAPFVVEGIHRTTTSSSGMVSERVYIYYHYYYYTFREKKNETKAKKRTIAGVFFTGTPETIWATISSNTFGNLDEGFNNYGIGYLKNYLQKINDEFEDEGYSFAYAENYDKKKLKALKTKTLFVPEFIKNKYHAWMMTAKGGTEEERDDEDSLFKRYEHSYEWISKEDLNDKIINATEDFYYLMYVRINSQKIIAVMNGFTGEIIYQDYQTMSYNIKKKDISRIGSKVK